MQIISCKSSIALATKIAEIKNFELIKTKTQSFTGGEIKIELPKTLSEEIYIVQSFAKSVNDELIELLLTVDAARASGANKINIISPYLPYSRQDAPKPMTSCGFQAISNLLNACNINRLITLDFHSSKALNLFSFPVSNISIEEIILPLTQDKLIICPDNGATERNKFDQATRLNKKRRGDDLSFELLDNVKDKDCLIVDDIIDSGKTICLAAQILKDNGAKSIHAYITHGLLSESTCTRLNESSIQKIYVSNSIENTLLAHNTITLDITKIIADHF